MSRFSDQVRDEFGREVPGVKVYVYEWDIPSQTTGVLSTLTDDDLTTPLVNPLTTDEFGDFHFNTANGAKLLEFHFGGKLQYREQILVGPQPTASQGGTVLNIDLFTNAALFAIPFGVDTVQTSGYSVAGKGHALYVYDVAVDAAYVTAHLRSSFISAAIGADAARGFRLGNDQTITPEMLGAPFDGSTDDLAAFNAAFALGREISLSDGTYVLSALPTVPAGSFVLKGVGKGKTNIIAKHNCSAGALSFAPASVNNRIELKGFTLIAGNSGAPCQFGVIVTFPSVSSYPYRQVEIDIDFQSDLGAVAPWANTWGRGIRLTNAWYPLLNVNGSSAPIVGDTGNTGFLEVTGGSYGMVGADINVVWYYGADGIRCSAYIEGLKLSSGTEFVGVTKGVYVPATTPLGGAAVTYRSAFIDIGYAHIAAGSVGIDLDTVLDLKVDRSVERWGSATGWIGLKLNQVLDPKIHCRISGNGAGISSTGIVATGGNSAHGIVEHVHFDNLDTQFSLDGSTSHWTIRNNVSTGVTADVFSLLGTNHDVEWLNAGGYIQRTVNGIIQTGSLYSAVGELGKVNAAGVTYTAAEFLSDAIFRSGAATVSDTTPTAAQIVAAIPGAVVGTGKRITINNQNSGVLTLVAGTGVTLVGTTTVTNAFARNYLIRITNAAPGSEAVRLIGLQTGAI